MVDARGVRLEIHSLYLQNPHLVAKKGYDTAPQTGLVLGVDASGVRPRDSQHSTRLEIHPRNLRPLTLEFSSSAGVPHSQETATPPSTTRALGTGLL